MLNIYIFVSFLFSFALVCDFLMDLYIGSSLDNFIQNYDDTRLPFLGWMLWKGFVFSTAVVEIGLMVLISLFVSALAGWIIFPIHVLCNLKKYNPFEIWKKQNKSQGEDK